jgi:copper(I)-binding protein
VTGRGRARAATARRAALTVLTAVTVLAGARTAGGGGDGGSPPELTVSGAFVPEPVEGADMAAGFLTIENTGGTDDTLTGVSSGAAGSVEMHVSADGTMRRVDSFPVPAGGELRLQRGGDHLMLLGLTRPLAEGDTLSMELEFATSDPITIEVPVEAATYTGDDGGHGGHGEQDTP